MPMTEEDLKALVPAEQHADFDSLVGEIRTSGDPLREITPDKFNELLKGNTELKKVLDSRITQGIDTWQKNNLDTIYRERYAKENPEESESDKRLKALEVEVAEGKRREGRANMRADTIKELTEKTLPIDLVDFLIGDDAEKTAGNVAVFESALAGYGQKIKDQVLKENGRKIDQDKDGDAEKYYTIDQLNTMTPAEQSTNFEKVTESYKYHQQRG